MATSIESVYIDDLTGVLNRRYLYERLKDEIESVDREGRSLWMAIIDVDDFKAINDTYGHLEGDNILREVASIFRRSVRASDKVIRFGGDEFILLLIDGGLISALTVLKRIRENISRHRFSTGIAGLTIEVSISIGLAGYPDDTTDADKLLSLADEALYIAKSKGKDSVALVSDIPSVTLLSRDILELFPSKKIVGREKELAAIKEFLISGNESVLGVTGAFGIGKTRLLKEAEKIGSMYSFIPFFAATYGSRYPLLYELWRCFENNYLDIYPDLLEKFSEKTLEEIKKLETQEDSQKIITFVDELIRQILDRYNILFIIDDLFYADEDSLWGIVRLLRNYPNKVKIIFSVDSDVDSETVRSYLAIFESRFSLRLLTLKPFDEDLITGWLNGVLNSTFIDKRIVSLLYKVSHGNIMFLEEIMKYLMAKKLVYKVSQNWVFRPYEEIEAEIGAISFSDLVRKRVYTLDEILIKELLRLNSMGKDVSNVWKLDVGVVRKGYLLDVVKAFHRDKLLHNRNFFVEDYPNVAVQEIFSIIAGDQRDSLLRLEIKGDLVKELREKLVKVLTEVTHRGRKLIENKEVSSCLQEFLKAFLEEVSSFAKAKSVSDLFISLEVFAEKCVNLLTNILSQTSYLELSIERNKFFVNGVLFDIEHEISRGFLNLFEEIELNKLSFFPPISKYDIEALMCMIYLRKNESMDYTFFSSSVSVGRSITVSQVKDLIENIISWNTFKDKENSLEELHLAEKLAFSILIFGDTEEVELMNVLKEIFSQSPYLYRMFLLGLFLHYPYWGLPPFVKYIVNKMPPDLTAGELSLLYQHRMIPFQFVRELLKVCYADIREEILSALGEDIVKKIELSFPDKDEKYKVILSMSDVDRWGEVLFHGAEFILLNLSSDLHMLSLFVDSFEMSFGDQLFLFEVAPLVWRLVDSLYNVDCEVLARKVVDSFLTSILQVKDNSDRTFLSIKQVIKIVLRKEKDSKFIRKMIDMLKTTRFDIYKKLIRDAEITTIGFELITRFFKLISEGQCEDVELIWIIFSLGSAPMKHFLRKLVLSEDISSFGYFDSFLARRLVGSHVPGDRKEEVLLFLSSYLSNDLWYVVRNAMELLSYVIIPSEVGVFRPLLYHPNERIRKRLVFILGRLRGKEAERMLIDMLRNETNQDIQERIYNVLKRSDDPEIVNKVGELI